MAKYYFNNSIEFDTFLNTSDISVPLRSKGRKTEHTERYSIINYFSKFRNELFNKFPIKLIHSDKPDFRIFTQTDTIGIEVTESIPEQLARASYLLEIHFPDGGKLEPVFFGWDAPERTNDEILEIFKKSNVYLIGQGFYGNSIEEKWLIGIKGCIKNKTYKLNKDGFEKFQNNWLLIYDNQTKSFLDKKYVTEKLSPFLSTYWTKEEKTVFDKVLIDSGSVFYIFDKSSKDSFSVIAKLN